MSLVWKVVNCKDKISYQIHKGKMFLTKSEHSKRVKTFLMPLKNIQVIMLIPYKPKVLFSPCDLGTADTPIERKTGTPC